MKQFHTAFLFLAATAAGASHSEARAITNNITLVMDPTNAVSDDYFLYGTNTSGNSSVASSISPAPANTVTVVNVTEGALMPAYTVIGLYGAPANGNVVVAFSAAEVASVSGPIGKTFDTFFGVSEASIAADLQTGNIAALQSFYNSNQQTIGIPIGTGGSFVDFSTGTVGGTVSAVPEPSTWMAAGSLLLLAAGDFRRRLRA